ncbi:hypothetical protein GH733_019471 [Mirounga leonina]|nr:hypothetical protein GH733_019471 [Mirounga leonina]
MVLQARKASRSYDAPSRSLERRILRQKVEGNSSYTPSICLIVMMKMSLSNANHDEVGVSEEQSFQI